MKCGTRAGEPAIAPKAATPRAVPTAHLNKLRAGGLIEVEASGRHRYYRLTGPDIAAALEALLGFCTDWTEQRHHLAGALGAALLTALCDHGCLTRSPRRVVQLTERGAATLRERLGLDLHPAEM